MPRLNNSSNQKICINRKFHGDGTHEVETSRHPINHKQVKTIHTITTYTTIRYCRGHSGRNLLNNTSTRQQQNTLLFMSVKIVKGYVASDQTGKFRRMSNKGMQYICAFNIYDPNFIKGVALKSRKKEELLQAYKEVYTFCKTHDFNLDYTRWTMKHKDMLKISLQARTLNSSTPLPTAT